MPVTGKAERMFWVPPKKGPMVLTNWVVVFRNYISSGGIGKMVK